MKRFSFILAVLLAVLPVSAAVIPSFAEVSGDVSGSVSGDVSDVSSDVSDTSSGELTPYTAKNAAAAYCVNTKQLLYSERGEESLAPGASCKLMAAMIAYDLLKDCERPLSAEVEVKTEWVQGSYTAGDRSSPYLNLKGGETYTLEYLFNATLVANANDACAVLVHYCAQELLSGTEADFVRRMNERAAEIGMTNTVYETAVGFGGRGRTTVSDMAVLGAAFYYYNDLVEMSSQASYGRMKNKNYLKSNFAVDGYLMKDALGMIAGQSSDRSGYCVITAYEVGDIACVFVSANAPGEKIDEDGKHFFDQNNAYDDIRGMVPYITSLYTLQVICKTDDIVTELRLGGGAEKDFLLLVPSENITQMIINPDKMPLEKQITYNTERVYEGSFNGKTVWMTDAPVKQGDVLGSVTYLLDGKALATVDLLAQTSADTNVLKTTFSSIADFLFNGSMGTILKITLGVVGLWVAISVALVIKRIVNRIQDRKKRNGENKNVKK